MDIEEIIEDLLYDGKDAACYALSLYETAYLDGYHDALVDLMNKLGIEHNEEIIYH